MLGADNTRDVMQNRITELDFDIPESMKAHELFTPTTSILHHITHPHATPPNMAAN